MSEIVNTTASKIQREIKETLQWPPIGKSGVVSARHHMDDAVQSLIVSTFHAL